MRGFGRELGKSRFNNELKIFAEYPATRNQLGPSHDLVFCGKESARYYTKVFSVDQRS